MTAFGRGQRFAARMSLVRMVVALAVMIGFIGAAGAVETTAPRAMILETDTGSVLFEKRADAAFSPANFTKLMTAAVVFDALARGEVKPDTLFPISEHAWRTGGAPARVTTMFAKVKSEVPVDALVKGLIVQYANDAAIALAEGLTGSEEAFADRMNAHAAVLGLKGSRFANPTGFAAPDARTTLRDVVRLADLIRLRHPGLYGLYRAPEFEWNGILQINKTPYIRDLAGAEGLVLAFDERDGFGAVVAVERDGRRMLVAASGLRTPADRDREIRQLVDAAYAEFSRIALFPVDAVIASVRVFGGTEARVDVIGSGPIVVTLPNGERDEFRARVAYDGPIRAPVQAGAPVARLEIRVEGRLYQEVPLVAAREVPTGDLTDRARDGLRELLVGWW